MDSLLEKKNEKLGKSNKNIENCETLHKNTQIGDQTSTV